MSAPTYLSSNKTDDFIKAINALDGLSSMVYVSTYEPDPEGEADEAALIASIKTTKALLAKQVQKRMNWYVKHID